MWGAPAGGTIAGGKRKEEIYTDVSDAASRLSNGREASIENHENRFTYIEKWEESGCDAEARAVRPRRHYEKMEKGLVSI